MMSVLTSLAPWCVGLFYNRIELDIAKVIDWVASTFFYEGAREKESVARFNGKIGNPFAHKSHIEFIAKEAGGREITTANGGTASVVPAIRRLCASQMVNTDFEMF